MDTRIAFMMFHNGRKKSVSAAMQGFNVTRRVRGIAKGIAQLGHGLIEATIEIDKGMRGPKLLAKFFSCNKFAWTLQKKYEDLKWLLLKLYQKPVLA
ncbi:MAG TPA: hypothetical protein VFW94_16285 [Candidatus Acidoferrales bacterium]|nr:hypothetical protein [Candidatus Acidoferrales bacterium]